MPYGSTVNLAPAELVSCRVLSPMAIPFSRVFLMTSYGVFATVCSCGPQVAEQTKTLVQGDGHDSDAAVVSPAYHPLGY